MAGLDPAIHQTSREIFRTMDTRVKPAYDGGEILPRSSQNDRSLTFLIRRLFKPPDLPVALTCRRRFACDVGQITGTSSRVFRPHEGRLADRHKTLAEDAVDATAHKTNAPFADGEVVWS
jgi:hypothetical protein